MQFSGNMNMTYIPMINGDRFRVYTRNCHHIHYKDSAVYYVNEYSKNDNNSFRYAFEISKDKNHISRIDFNDKTRHIMRGIHLIRHRSTRQIEADYATIDWVYRRIRNNKYTL